MAKKRSRSNGGGDIWPRENKAGKATWEPQFVLHNGRREPYVQ